MSSEIFLWIFHFGIFFSILTIKRLLEWPIPGPQEKKGDKLEKERRKGRGIKRQLEIWDSLLEVRIQLQKVMCKVNQLPQLTNFEAVKNQAGDSEDRGAGVPIKQVVKTAQTSLTSALDEMLGKKKQPQNI